MVYTVTDADAGLRLDSFVSREGGITRSAAVRAIDEGRVTVCGALQPKKYILKSSDTVEFSEADEPMEYDALPEDIPLDVVYEDGDIIVINKPSGMVVHPAAANYSGTLVNALLYHCRGSLSGIGGVMRPGIVHRIDKDTSGLLVCAKNDAAHTALSAELEHHGIEREYHALVKGGFKADTGTVNLPIGRHPADRKKMAVLTSPTAHAKEAVTHYEVLERFGQISYLKLRLETGRTHQIRVHMAHTGHPLLGDEVYGGSKTPFEKQHAPLLCGQVLHAKRLTLTHPKTKQRMVFETELPSEFTRLLEILRAEY